MGGGDKRFWGQHNMAKTVTKGACLMEHMFRTKKIVKYRRSDVNLKKGATRTKSMQIIATTPFYMKIPATTFTSTMLP